MLVAAINSVLGLEEGEESHTDSELFEDYSLDVSIPRYWTKSQSGEDNPSTTLFLSGSLGLGVCGFFLFLRFAMGES